MNFLIVGGLLAFAVLAIVVAVILSISEQRSEKARVNAATTSLPTVPVMEQPAEVSRSVRRTVPLNRQDFPVAAEKPIRTSNDEQTLPALNGQFHEFAAELRSLYQQAWELEQRLHGLTEMVDRIEERQNNRISIEEELHAHSSGDNV